MSCFSSRCDKGNHSSSEDQNNAIPLQSPSDSRHSDKKGDIEVRRQLPAIPRARGSSLTFRNKPTSGVRRYSSHPRSIDFTADNLERFNNRDTLHQNRRFDPFIVQAWVIHVNYIMRRFGVQNHDEIAGRANNEIARRANDEIARRANDEIARRANDEIARRANDEIARRANDEIARRANDEIARRANDEQSRRTSSFRQQKSPRGKKNRKYVPPRMQKLAAERRELYQNRVGNYDGLLVCDNPGGAKGHDSSNRDVGNVTLNPNAEPWSSGWSNAASQATGSNSRQQRSLPALPQFSGQDDRFHSSAEGPLANVGTSHRAPNTQGDQTLMDSVSRISLFDDGTAEDRLRGYHPQQLSEYSQPAPIHVDVSSLDVSSPPEGYIPYRYTAFGSNTLRQRPPNNPYNATRGTVHYPAQPYAPLSMPLERHDVSEQGLRTDTSGEKNSTF